jgi:hypothetical protein
MSLLRSEEEMFWPAYRVTFISVIFWSGSLIGMVVYASKFGHVA